VTGTPSGAGNDDDASAGSCSGGHATPATSQASTSTFFLLLVLSFIDVLGGFAVTLRTAQRDLTVEGIDRAY